jgi:hypothetical protein
MVAIAGQYLNVVLKDLKQKRNLKINRVTQMLTIQPAVYGPFALDADYLRTYDLFYPLPTAGGGTQSSLIQFLVPITMEQFDAEFKSPSLSNYPYEFATDLSSQAQVWSGGSQGVGTLTSAGQLFIYPQTSGQIIMTHRYMKDQPDIVAPETNAQEPWFADDDYLIKATAARLMGTTGDDRRAEYFTEAEKTLFPYLLMEGDEQQAVVSVRLDPRKFKFIRGLRPTKLSPF